jgi:hypothetical protein
VEATGGLVLITALMLIIQIKPILTGMEQVTLVMLVLMTVIMTKTGMVYAVI